VSSNSGEGVSSNSGEGVSSNVGEGVSSNSGRAFLRIPAGAFPLLAVVQTPLAWIQDLSSCLQEQWGGSKARLLAKRF
jgi:hypothetical protein